MTRRLTATPRKFLALLAVSAAATFAVAGPAPAASAGSWGCSGTQVNSWPVSGAGVRMGTIYLYRDSNDVYCVVNVAYGSFYGRSGKDMSVSLSGCVYDASGFCDVVGTPHYDNGPYLYYAGPESMSGVGVCLQIYGQVDDSYYGVGDGGPGGPDYCG